MIPEGKKNAIIKFLTKTKHKDGKYLIEFFNVKIDGETIICDLNIIPTEDNSSYVYKGFICSSRNIINELLKFISLDYEPIIEFDNTYFNGEQVNVDEDYSFSETFIKKIESKMNRMLSEFKTVKSINHQRTLITFKSEYKVSHIEDERYGEIVFFIDGTVTDLLFNDVSQEDVPNRLKDLISGYLPYFQEDDRIKISDYMFDLLSEDQNLCDVEFYTIILYNNVLGVEPEHTEAYNSDIFFSAIEDFVNGDY